jgi:hypothetical protein
MKSSDPQTSACRRCRYYVPEGRRGGHCSQLSASVQGSWKACSLAAPVFEATWELERMLVWPGETTPTYVNQIPSPLTQNTDQKATLDRATRSEKFPKELMV